MEHGGDSQISVLHHAIAEHRDILPDMAEIHDMDTAIPVGLRMRGHHNATEHPVLRGDSEVYHFPTEYLQLRPSLSICHKTLFTPLAPAWDIHVDVSYEQAAL